MIRKDIVRRLMKALPVSKDIAHEVITLITEQIKTALLEGRRIEIRGFGVFELRPRKLGQGRNIKKGGLAKIRKGLTVKFKPGLKMKAIPTD